MTETDYADKDAYTEALQAEELRKQITKHAAGATQHSVSRDWANEWLRRLGAAQITGRSEYRMNVPLTGNYGWRCKANSRAEAAQRFLEQVQRVAEAGKITADGSYDNVYDVKFDEPVTAADVVFRSGPEDPTEFDGPVPGLDALKVEIRKMLMEGVSEQGWGYQYAQQALRAMGLEPMPARVNHTVSVPVSGVSRVTVQVFEGDLAEVIQKAAASKIAKLGNSLVVTPEEVGEAVLDEDAEDEVENEDVF
jgi:hypothetical protein